MPVLHDDQVQRRGAASVRLATDTNRQFIDLRGDMNRQFTELREDVNRRLGTLDEKGDRHFTWMVGTQVALLLAMVGALVGAYYRQRDPNDPNGD